MTAGYLLDSIGLPMHPAVLAVCAAAGFALAFAGRDRRGWAAPAGSLIAAAAMWTYAMWIASPAFLPVTNGPDVVHHLQLIHFIARTWRLPHDPTLGGYLLEMMGYTPGAHIVAAAAGAWLRVDPLRVVYPLAALFVSLKVGMLYEIARRTIGGQRHATIASAAAPVLVLVPSAYSLGAFVQFFYFGQAVSETFAVGVMLASVAWVESGRRRDLALAAACAAGVVLSWPIWIGPCAVTIGAAVLSRPETFAVRAGRLAATLAPAAILAVLHQSQHPAAASILTSTGAVTEPALAVFGAGFAVLAVAGAALALPDKSARLVLIFLVTVLAQAVMLRLLAAQAGSASFYMTFKMMYLAVPPAAVLGAFALARLAAIVAARLPQLRILLVCLPVVVAALLVRGRIPVHRAHGWISLPARDAGLWARHNLPPACVDYFTRYWLTAYWLHVDVLGNPRVSTRMSRETFEFSDAVAKWIEGRGLPYAVVEDLPSTPRDVRVDMEPLTANGSFTVVRNRLGTACQ